MEPAFYKTHMTKLKKIIKIKTRKINKINLINFQIKISFLPERNPLKTNKCNLPSRKCGQNYTASKTYDCIQAKRSIHCIFNHRRVQIEWKKIFKKKSN